MTLQEEYKVLKEKAQIQIVRSPSGNYWYKDWTISKIPSGKITKRFGWDVFKGNDRVNKVHFKTLKEAKEYVLQQ